MSIKCCSVLFNLQEVVDIEHEIILYQLHDEGKMLYGVFIAHVQSCFPFFTLSVDDFVPYICGFPDLLPFLLRGFQEHCLA